ncbi:MAG: choice-of-anchor X domain-containing protein, partial [Planctomycetota bacterium]
MSRRTLVLGLFLGPLASTLWGANALAQQSTLPPALVPRQVAAPASDLIDGTLRLPPPSAGAVRCRGSLFPLDWRGDGAKGWRAEVSLPVAQGALGLAVHAMGASSYEVDVTGAGLAGPLSATPAERRDQTLPAEAGGEDVQRWDLALERAGVVRITVVARGDRAPAPALLAVRDAQPLTAAAYIDSHERVADRELALVAQVERDGDGLAEDRLLHTVATAWAELEGPGVSRRQPQADDGRCGDGAAGDGRFGVRLPAGLSGAYAARIVLRGTWGGAAFVRTTRVTFEVAEPLLVLTGRVGREVLDARRMRLDIDAIPTADARRVQVSAEVWAHDSLGRARPMAWLSRIDLPRPGTDVEGHWSLPLWLDAGWFGATGLRPPLELR